MRKVGLAVAAAAAALPLAVPQQASADTPGCVTRQEFSHAHHGMTKARVNQIFDTKGWVAFYTNHRRDQVHRYRACPRLKRQGAKPTVVYHHRNGVWILTQKKLV